MLSPIPLCLLKVRGSFPPSTTTTLSFKILQPVIPWDLQGWGLIAAYLHLLWLSLSPLVASSLPGIGSVSVSGLSQAPASALGWPL